MVESQKLPISVWLGPARSGKTEACIDLYAESGPRAWLLVPTADQAASLRGRRSGLDSKRIGTFADLIRHLSGVESEAVIRAAARRGLVAGIYERRISPGGYFARMQGMSGFVGALCELISELTLSEVKSQSLKDGGQAAATALGSDSLARKADELADMFADYESFLSANGNQDDDGMALDAARRISSLPSGRIPEVVIVDGFYRLSRAWRTLLGSLAQSGCRVVITLPHEANRPTLFRTPGRTLAELKLQFDVSERIFQPRHNPEPDSLDLLERNLFGESAESDSAQSSTPQHPVLLIDAPNPYAEAEAVLRQIRRSHDDDGVGWGEVLIVLRTPAEYGSILTSISERFDIRLSMQTPTTLAGQPAVKAAAGLLRIIGGGWKRNDILTFLRAGLGACGRIESDHIRRLAQKSAVPDGYESWGAFAMSLEDRPARQCLDRLLAWQEEFSAPDLPPTVLAGKLRAAAHDLSLIPTGDSASEILDLQALTVALQAADSLSAIHEKVDNQAIPFEQWAERVSSAWSAATITPPSELDAVMVVDAYDTRQRYARMTAVMGLTERSFPRKVNEDPFFRDDEREALREAGLAGLEPELDRADDERLLFYSAVTSCWERLILSYPRASSEGDCSPSFFLDDVRTAVPEIQTLRLAAADVTPADSHCANERDRQLNKLAILIETALAQEDSLPWKDRLIAASASHEGLEDIARTAALPPLPRISNPSLRARYATPRRLSVTELESYNRCPYQHFTGHAVKPDSTGDGAGAGDRGAVYHRAIGVAFRRRKKGDPDHSELTAEKLLEALNEAVESHRADAGPYRKGLMRRFLEQALAGFARREADYGLPFDSKPAHFELAFGLDLDNEEALSREYDPRSTPHPLEITSTAGDRTVQICGAIDRVDLLGDSGAVMVVDYKTGGSPAYKLVKEGQSLQMPLYLLAIERLFGWRGAVACYDSAREPGRRRMFRTELAALRRFGFQSGIDKFGDFVKPLNEEEYREATDRAIEAVLRAAEKMAAADILPTPGDHCRTCDYRDFCRTSLDSVHDGEPFDLLTESSS